MQGYSGLYSLNETINRLLVLPELNSAEIPERLEKFITDNLIQLIEIYENVTTAGTIVEKSEINPEKSHNDLRVLLALNLGDAVKKNVTEIRRYMNIHKRNSSDLDNIYYNEIRVQKLDGLVAGAYTLFENVLDSPELEILLNNNKTSANLPFIQIPGWIDDVPIVTPNKISIINSEGFK